MIEEANKRANSLALFSSGKVQKFDINIKKEKS